MENEEKACYQTLSTALCWIKSNANQRNDENLRKSWNHSFLTTEKINIPKIYVGPMTKVERYSLECEEYGHKVRNTVTKTHSWFLKVKNQ